MLARQIKDLSIALEALSRVPGYTASTAADYISDSLVRLTKTLKEDLTNLDKEPTATKPNEDEIPF